MIRGVGHVRFRVIAVGRAPRQTTGKRGVHGVAVLVDDRVGHVAAGSCRNHAFASAEDDAAGEPAKTSTLTVVVNAPHATSMVCGPEVYGAKVEPSWCRCSACR